MKAEDIVVLHLSDLHFSGKSLRSVHEELLDDVRMMLSGAKQIVILVTGDIMDRGRFRCQKKTAVAFFHKLRDCIPKSAKIIYLGITPGNHDYKRADSKTRFNNSSYKPDTSQFDRLLVDIYQEFGFASPSRFGLDVVEYNGVNLCFARIDSSWHETEADLKNRAAKGAKKMGRSQEDISNALKSNIEKYVQEQRAGLLNRWETYFSHDTLKPYLTFVLSHLPLTLLLDTGLDEVRKVLRCAALKSVNYWICGHLHYAKIRQVKDDGLQITTLMSGIGNEKKEADTQRYSIYTLSLERNTCNVCIRVSRNGGGFDYDWNANRTWSGAFENGSTLHLKLGASMPFVRLNAARDDMESIACSVDSEMLPLIQAAHRISVTMIESIMRHTDYLRRRIIERDDDGEFEINENASELLWRWYNTKNSKLPDEVYDLVKNEISRKKLVKDLLENICTDICVELDRVMDDRSGQKPIWRTHFRRFSGKIESDGSVARDGHEIYVEKSNRDRNYDKAKFVNWGGLLKGAFYSKFGMLVNSANPGVNMTETEWDDFTTLIPMFSGNKIRLECHSNDGGCIEDRPVLTFGISMKCSDFMCGKKASRLLYALECLNLNDTLSRGLNDLFLQCGIVKGANLSEVL